MLRVEGRARADKAQAMTGCVEDGLNASLTGVTKSTVRRTRREGMSRVETISTPYLLVSADIENSGEARLVEGPAAGMFSTSSEIEAFRLVSCVSRLGDLRVLMDGGPAPKLLRVINAPVAKI